MLKLLNLNKTVVRYLPKYRDLSVTEELKTGDQTLTFTLLEHNPSDIANEWYIETTDARYVIKETEKTMDDYPSYTCQLDLEDLEQTMFEQFTAANKTAAQAAALAIAGTGWTVTSSMAKQRSVQSFKLTPLQALGKIRDAFMCDLWFDSLNRVVHLEEERGEDRGVYFLAGLNLKDLKTTVDNYDYYTRLIPIGKDDLRINAVNAGVGYVENYQYSNKIRTLIWEDTSYEDANILKEDAIAKLADLSKPKKSYKASVRDLAKQKPGYSILSYNLGDTVTIADRSTGVRDTQRIVKLVRYPDSPEKNTCELSNAVLTFEEQQDRLNAAAAAWESVSNTDGTVNGVWVHGVRAGDVVGVEVTTGGSTTTTNLNNAVSIMQGDTAAVVSDLQAATARIGTIEATYLTAASAALTYATITNLDASNARISAIEADYLTATNAALTYATIANLEATDARIDNLGATYATIDMANVTAGSIKTAMIDTGAVQTAQIADGSITDAKIVTLTANKITAGTLSVERLEIRGSNTSLVYALNNITGALQSQNVNTINGEVLTQRTVTADRIVANAITANEIAASTITGNEIAANTITAGKLNVTTLSAITANMGTITGGTLKLGTNAVTQLNNDGTGHIGAWNFDATKLYNGTYGSDSSVYFSTANMSSKAIGGRTGSDWRLTVGSKFGVTNTGAVYASSLTASGGSIGGWTILSSSLKSTYTDSGGDTSTIVLDSANRKITMSDTGQVVGFTLGEGYLNSYTAVGTGKLQGPELKLTFTTVSGQPYASLTPRQMYINGKLLMTAALSTWVMVNPSGAFTNGFDFTASDIKTTGAINGGTLYESGTLLVNKYALKSVVDELNTNLAYTSASLNTEYGAVYRKWGHVVTLTVVKYAVTLSSGDPINVGTLPSGFRPPATIRESNYQGTCYISIDTNGTVTISRIGSSAVTANLLFNMSYMVG